jgi:hypothetical protein
MYPIGRAAEDKSRSALEMAAALIRLPADERQACTGTNIGRSWHYRLNPAYIRVLEP